ncbi:DUF2163 domain-containing protein [Sphingobium aquiterrae]|uniref:DUF2163 domain-containing protein n=1 Tax=Sphingobium aquiterrae TaxID=2038656 RepID=UPI003016B1A3
MSAAEILAQPLAALAFCWRLARRDGVTIGLTSHDRDLAVDGLVYRAAPGMVPSAVRWGTSASSESMDVRGMIGSDAISDVDLDAGRWDGAALWLHLTEWTDPGALWLELARGTIGAVERAGNGFTAELVGPSAVLDEAVAPATSPDCRAALGDGACRVDLALRRAMVSVVSVEDAQVAIAGGGLVEGPYVFGTLRWLTGENAGMAQAIVASTGGQVTLTDPPAFAVLPGTRAMLTEGCDKRIETCAARFGNAINFQGEPYLPGNDLLTRYPGAG